MFHVKPSTFIRVGATKTDHLKEIIGAAELKLSREEVEALEKPYRPHPVLGHEQPKPAKMVKMVK
jgi:1-deoxyxylulose-5-phosphate synthase